jgi:ABC-type antimicrobial peptide transport system permease subunit
MGQVLTGSTAGRRFSMLLVALFSATALLLIVTGTYGVVSFGVSQRTHEIGVRMTLGANKRRVVEMFIRRAGSLVGVGLTAGILGAFVVSIVIGSLVFGISSASLVHMAAAAGVMILVGLVAVLVPLRKAMSVDPLDALRVE